MAGKCAKCGKVYNRYSLDNLLRAELCDDCFHAKVNAENAAKLEAKERAENEARARIVSIIKHHVPSENVQVFGIAYWITAGTTANTAFRKTMGAFWLGGLGYASEQTSHHVGIIAVTETRLYVIETGSIIGGDVHATEVAPSPSSLGTAKSASLKDIRIPWYRPVEPNVLSIAGEIHLSATFPDSYEPGNADKAEQIMRAIKAGGKA